VLGMFSEGRDAIAEMSASGGEMPEYTSTWKLRGRVKVCGCWGGREILASWKLRLGVEIDGDWTYLDFSRDAIA